MSRFFIVALLLGLAMGASAQGYPGQPSAPPPPPPPPGAPPGAPLPPPPGAPPPVANVHYGWAEVLRVDPVYATPPTQQECYPTTVTRQDDNHTGGTVLGAIVGGVLGSTLGHGRGRTATTVAGAVAGGAIGNRVSAANDQSYTTQQTVCQPAVYPQQPQIVAYDVEYRYRGDVYMSRLSYDPGERLRVSIAVAPAQ